MITPGLGLRFTPVPLFSAPWISFRGEDVGALLPTPGLTRYDGELREPLMWRQGSQVSMRVGDSGEGDVTADKVTGEDGELVSSTEAGLVQDTSWGPLLMRVLISECVNL